MSNQIKLIESVINNFKTENSLGDNMSFELFSISQVLKKYDIDFQDIEDSDVDGGNDGGIDNVFIFINNRYINNIEEIKELEENNEIDRKTTLEIYIIQAKASNGFKEKVWDTLSLTFQDIFDYSKSEKDLKGLYNEDLIEKTIMMRYAMDKVMSISNNIALKTLYLSKGDTKSISTGLENRGNLLKESLKEKTSISNIEILYYGGKELREIYTEPEELELIMKYSNQMSSTFLGEQNTAYVLTVNLKEYYNFFTKDEGIRENILENNIRHFQGNVAVNRGIINTLEEDTNTEFWWLNNGVTMLASEIVSLPNNQLRIKNAQIVNGLQTTFCIYDFFNKKNSNEDNETRKILVKIIQINDLKVTDNIISYTNSQTSVRPADLRATDKFQRDIEEFFLSEGYYYDRRKNYYKNMNKDRSKIFSIGKTAQYIETLIYKNPSSARQNPTSLLKTDENYKKIFNSNINVKTYLNSCLIYKEVEKNIKELTIDLILEKYGASIKNFTFHLMLILVTIKLEKIEFNHDEIANIDINDLDDKIFSESLAFINTLIEEVNNEKRNDNIINMAKSKNFTDKLMIQLKNYIK